MSKHPFFLMVLSALIVTDKRKLRFNASLQKVLKWALGFQDLRDLGGNYAL